MRIDEFEHLIKELKVPPDFVIRFAHESGGFVSIDVIEIHNDIGTVLMIPEGDVEIDHDEIDL